MDRLIAAAAWHEPQSLEQALLVADSQAGKIDWSVLDEWVIREGISRDKEVIEFYKRIGRRHP
jgi:hypothetical protein